MPMQGGKYKREDVQLQIAAVKITPFVKMLREIFSDAGFTSTTVKEAPSIKKEEFIFGNEVTPDIIKPVLNIITRELGKNPYGSPTVVPIIDENVIAFSLKLESCNRSAGRNIVKKKIYFDPELGCHMNYTDEEAEQRNRDLATRKKALRKWTTPLSKQTV